MPPRSAQWRSETLGVSADGAGYRFWRRGADDRWSALADDDVLAPRALPDGVHASRPCRTRARRSPPMSILPFRPSGRNEPYALVARLLRMVASIVAGDPLNRVHIAALADSR